MPHVVTARCVGCRYTDCAAVCPVDCFFEVADPAMLVIDPDTCIDCELCVTACPVHAIYPEDEVPDVYQEWIEKNAELVADAENITEQKEPLPTARDLEVVQAEEKEKGWDVEEPSNAS